MGDQTVKALIVGGSLLVLVAVLMGEVLSFHSFGLKGENLGMLISGLRVMAVGGFLCVLGSCLIANKLTESGKWRLYMYGALGWSFVGALLLISLDPPV
jgi:hypothetical protein